MLSIIKSGLLLVAIAVVWICLLLFTWRGWWQIIVSVAAIKVDKLKSYRYSLWISQDQDVNAIFFGNPDATISSRIGVLALMGSKTAYYMSEVIDWLFYKTVGQENHCVASIEHDEKHYTFQQRLEAQT